MTSKTPLRDLLFGTQNAKLTFEPEENLTIVIEKHGQQLEPVSSGPDSRETSTESTSNTVETRWEYETQVGRKIDWVSTYKKYPELSPRYEMYRTCYHDEGVDTFLTKEKAIKYAKDGNSSTGRIRSVRVETTTDIHDPITVVE